MKKNLGSTALLGAVFLLGLGLLLYPTVSDHWNSLHQSRAVADYAEQVAGLDTSRYDILLEEARAYNRSLLEKRNPYRMTEENLAEYEKLLDVSGNGILGYVEIPAIGCSLPLYHGVAESVLQVAVGHIEWTSLPVGGESTHSVFSGHRGLPSAKLFSDLDKLVPGDRFVLRVLDETLTYEVDQIRIVEPQEVKELRIVEGEDYCTLVTCTPYGINSHRLLVRGSRTENREESKAVFVTADAMLLPPELVAVMLGGPVLLVLFIAAMLPGKGGKWEDDW